MREIVTEEELNTIRRNDEYLPDAAWSKAKALVINVGGWILVVVAIAIVVFFLALSYKFYDVVTSDQVLLMKTLSWLFDHAITFSLGFSSVVIYYKVKFESKS